MLPSTFRSIEREPAKMLRHLCEVMEEAHGWQPMVEIWLDKYGITHLAMKYVGKHDGEFDGLRVWHTIERKFETMDDAVLEFCKECADGLE